MTGQNANNMDDEQPLDPAAERMRRKLVRFMGINLAILFTALMAVVGALVYRSMSSEDNGSGLTSPVPVGETLAGQIEIPAGARIISHAVSGNRLTLHLRNADGGEAIEIYDLANGQSLGKVNIVRQIQ